MKAKKIYNSEGFPLRGALVINVKKFTDIRGFFFESWNQKEFNNIVGRNINFVQDNHSRSFLGVLRGMHYQLNPKPQGKLVRATHGRIFDVLVDLRKDSLTFGTWAGVELNSKDCNQLWVPPGFAHGFLTISDVAEVQYKTTNFWEKELERSIYWNDPTINIKWPLNNIDSNIPSLSEKDSNAQSFLKSKKLGEVF